MAGGPRPLQLGDQADEAWYGDRGLATETQAAAAFVIANNADNAAADAQNDIDGHMANLGNPHGVTKTQVGLANADNTSDANKPISTATQTALDLKAPLAGTLAQFAATTSAQLRGVISDETGTGVLVFADTPTLITPLLGTPTSGTLTNCTGYTWTNIASKPTTLAGFGITDGQPIDATLTAMAALTIANNSLTVGKGADSFAQVTFAAGTFPARAAAGDLEAKTITDFGLSLIDDADASAARTTLGLGTLATQSGTFSGTSSGTNTGDQNLFSTIAVSGQSNVVADSATDTLTLIAGSNITITTNATNDEITIASTGSGAAWGSITGTLSSQTDLQSALDAKQATITAGNLIDITGATVDVDLSEAATATPAVDDTFLFTDVSNSNANAKATLEAMMHAYTKVRHRYCFQFFTHFVNETSGTGTDNAMSETVSGTGAGVSLQAVDTANRPGVVRASTGTTATGRAAIAVGTNQIRLGGGEWFYETAINIATLSSGTERYQFLAGFIDTVNAANQTDGVYLLYDDGGVSTGSAASTNWQLVTVNNGTRTFTTSSVAVGAAAWVRLTIEINADGTSVTFYADGVSLGTHTTNIPTGSTRVLGFGNFMIKSVGTTARTIDYDYVNVVSEFTTPT